MLKYFLLALYFGLLRPTESTISPTDTYAHTATLQDDGCVMYWESTDTEMIIEIHAKTMGWVGIGLSANGNMAEGDIAVGWVDSNGTARITDRHGASTNAFPPLDTQQDLEILEGKECDGWTILKFKRQHARCETNHDRDITTGTERVIWAYGASDPTDDDLVAGDQHTTVNRGTVSAYLREPADPPATLPANPSTVEMRADEFKVPAMTTYYNCKVFRMPEVSEKNHILKYEPVITEGNERYVHHMLIYKCGDELANQDELEADGQCYTNAMAHFATCSTVLIAWAIGGGSHTFSDAAGLPFGEDGDPVYVLLEIHYDNPDSLTTIVDSSGLKLTYSSITRDNDLGILEIGNFVDGAYHFIPPGVAEFLTRGICGKDCTAGAMATANTPNITVVGIMLHSHLAGRKIKLRHIRDGTEEPYIGFDETYDFNFQTVKHLNPHIGVESGDDLMLECTYSTEGKSTMTEGGLGTEDEMCLAYLVYYPRLDLAKCQSNVDVSISYPLVDITEHRIEGAGLSGRVVVKPDALMGQTVRDVMDEIEWDDAQVQRLQVGTLDASAVHAFICQSQSATIAAALPPLTITSAYTPDSDTCVAPTSALPQSKSAIACEAESGNASERQGSNFLVMIFMIIVAKMM